jgi:hypothetical protein
MSVGAIKKLLVLVNFLAVLGLAGTAYGFWSHREYLNGPHEWPDFGYTPDRIDDEVGQIENTNMVLGRFPVKVEEKPVEVEQPKEEKIESVLERLGEITSTITILPPYRPGGERPAITFKRRDNGELLTLALGDAIDNKPHPIFGDRMPIPVRYKFIGCEADPDNSQITYFLFDMKCDETDIQKIAWRGEELLQPLQTGAALPAGGEVVINGKEAVIVSEKEKARLEKEFDDKAKKEAEEKAKAEANKPKVEAVKPPSDEVLPDQVLPTAGRDGVPDDFYEEQDGVWTPTEEGTRYLEDNWKSIVEEARTSSYVNPDTGQREGLMIRRIPRGSVASKFGLYPDDVIKTVNGRAVRSKSEAINVVKDEIERKKRKIIEVGILRNGKLIKKRYNTSDPATRRAARELR